MKERRKHFAILTADVYIPEQQDLLHSIISEAQRYDIDITIVPDIFQPDYCIDYFSEGCSIYQMATLGC